MKRPRSLPVLLLVMINAVCANAQDDDQTITNPFGVTYLAPNANILAAPDGFTVGTAPSTAASLYVDGAQLGNDLTTFQTHTLLPNSTNQLQQWRMFKTSGVISNLGIGSIFCKGGSNNTFNLWANVDNLNFATGDLPSSNNPFIRASIYYRVGTATINSQTPFNQSGYFGLSLNPNFLTSSSSTGPFSLFHMVDASGGSTVGTYAPTLGFRGWMKNGITFTGNSDQMYIGHKYATVDGVQQNGKSQAVVQWSEGTLDGDRQSLSFLFTTTPAAGIGAVATDGLEIMRLWPESNTSGYVGIGDFNTAAATPSERLDLLDRTIRLRDFASPSTTWQNDTYDRVLVANPSDGRVYWRAASTLGAPGCQWSMPSASPNNVSTAFGAASATCPDNAEAVGIGIDLGSNTPSGKLDLRTSQFANGFSLINSTVASTTRGARLTVSGGTGATRGIDVQSTQGTGTNEGVHVDAVGSNTSGDNFGLYASLTGTSYRAYGVKAVAASGTWTEYGGEFISNGTGNPGQAWGITALVHGGASYSRAVQATSDANATTNFGIDATASGTGSNTFYGVSGTASSTSTAASVYGLYGDAAPSVGNTITSFALGVNGDAICYGTAYGFSDAALKDDIQDVTGALDRVLQLNPKTYTFRTAEFPQLNLSHGHHMGLIAQEVEAVLPDLVRDYHHPERVDSLGNVVSQGVDVKVLDYTALLPLLIAAVREQNGVIVGMQEQLNAAAQTNDRANDLQQQLDELRAQLSACCASGALQGGNAMGLTATEGAVIGDERKLIIRPNPFMEQTTLYFSLEKGGRVQLMANSADGKQLRVLSEAQHEAGQYQFEWNTTDLSPGVYYVTLLLDGEPIVKKAVRVKE